MFPKNNTKAYCIKAQNTWLMQIIKYTSNAFKLVDGGDEFLKLLKMFTSTRRSVTSKPILPGTMCGLIMKDAQDTITNMPAVK